MTAVESPSIETLQKENFLLHQEINHLREQLNWFQRQLFGKRSERNAANLNPDQLLLPGFENLEVAPEEKKNIPAHQRRKPHKNGQETITLDPNLPVKTVVLDIPEENKVCPETGKPLVKIAEEKSYKLAHTPGSYYIKEIIRPKYAHPNREELGILTAELPEFILPKCRADNSLLAEIVTQKFSDHRAPRILTSDKRVKRAAKEIREGP